MQGADPAAAVTIREHLKHWQQDPDLAGVRDAKSQAALLGAGARLGKALVRRGRTADAVGCDVRVGSARVARYSDQPTPGARHHYETFVSRGSTHSTQLGIVRSGAKLQTSPPLVY